MWHSVLERQIKKYLGHTDVSTAEMEQFFRVVNETYAHYDEDRAMTERSLDLSSKELTSINERLERDKGELEKFKLAVDSSFNHIVITDENARVIYANNAAEQTTGYTFGEMEGNTPALWGKQMSAEFYQAFWKVIKEEKKPYAGEITNKRKNGEIYIATIHVSPILGENGEVRFFVGVEQDVTQEKQREEEEKKHPKELEVLNEQVTAEKVRAEGILRYLRSIGEWVYATDRRGMIVFVNESAAKLVGREPDELIGLDAVNFFEFRMGDSREAERTIAWKSGIESPESKPLKIGTFFFNPMTQKFMPVSGSYGPIIEKDHVAGAIVVFQDITKRYELEQMKDRFLSVAAHQLRTPLGSMRWSMELLESGDLGELPEAAKAAVTELHKNSERMMILVNDLLSVSRIDQSTIKEIPEPTDLAEVLKEAAKTLEGEAQKKNIQFEFSFPKGDLPQVLVIKKHIFEAVENLVSNAIRYGRANGFIKMAIAVEGMTIALSVIDNGIGIPKADQPKLFAKFYRASNAAKSFTDGSGLGLSVVKSYVEESKGKISFESEEGVGTTFTVCFPIMHKS